MWNLVQLCKIALYFYFSQNSARLTVSSLPNRVKQQQGQQQNTLKQQSKCWQEAFCDPALLFRRNLSQFDALLLITPDGFSYDKINWSEKRILPLVIPSTLKKKSRQNFHAPVDFLVALTGYGNVQSKATVRIVGCEYRPHASLLALLSGAVCFEWAGLPLVNHLAWWDSTRLCLWWLRQSPGHHWIYIKNQIGVWTPPPHHHHPHTHTHTLNKHQVVCFPLYWWRCWLFVLFLALRSYRPASHCVSMVCLNCFRANCLLRSPLAVHYFASKLLLLLI